MNGCRVPQRLNSGVARLHSSLEFRFPPHHARTFVRFRLDSKKSRPHIVLDRLDKRDIVALEENLACMQVNM